MRRAFTLLVFLGAASAAQAEIAVLDNGTTLKLSEHRVEGDLLILALKDGGEVGVPASMVRGFVPDEILDEVVPAVEAAAAGTDIRALATAAAKRHGLDPELVMAVVAVESAFRAEAVSPKGAQGLMQLMPGTAADLGVKDAFDPAQNLDGGSRYLGALLNLYGGDIAKALAAYNAGAGTVKRHGGVPPYRETRTYIQRVLRQYKPKEKAKKS
jgi:soluble lytic murein transglycosylase-like protein